MVVSGWSSLLSVLAPLFLIHGPTPVRPSLEAQDSPLSLCLWTLQLEPHCHTITGSTGSAPTPGLTPVTLSLEALDPKYDAYPGMPGGMKLIYSYICMSPLAGRIKVLVNVWWYHRVSASASQGQLWIVKLLNRKWGPKNTKMLIKHTFSIFTRNCLEDCS